MTVSALPEGSYVNVIGPDGQQWVVHYHANGPESGLPVVFVHGSGPGASGFTNFQHNLEVLGDAGYRAVAPDVLGYGYSSKPTDVGYDLEMLADVLRQALDGLGFDKVVLVGNSMGGALSILFALTWPDRVAKLVLMAPGGLEPKETYMGMRGIRRMIKSVYGPDGITRDGMRRVFELQLFDSSLLTETLIDERFQVAETQPIHVFATLKVTNVAERLGEISCPVLALWGVDDQFCPVSGAMRLAQGVSDIEVIMLSKCGHWVMVEHAETFDRHVLAFLED